MFQPRTYLVVFTPAAGKRLPQVVGYVTARTAWGAAWAASRRGAVPAPAVAGTLAVAPLARAWQVQGNQPAETIAPAAPPADIDTAACVEALRCVNPNTVRRFEVAGRVVAAACTLRAGCTAPRYAVTVDGKPVAQADQGLLPAANALRQALAA